MAAPVSPRQASAAVTAVAAAPQRVDAAAGLALLDVGHLAPGSVAWPLAAAAAGVLVCAPPTLDGLAAGIGLLDELRDAAGVSRRWLVVCGEGPYRLRDVQQTVDPVPVIGHVPFELRAVRVLATGAGLPPRSALTRGVRQIAEHLARELPMPSARPDAQTTTTSVLARSAVSSGGSRPAAPAYLEMYDPPDEGALSSNGHGHRQGGRA
ncbi:hypothetical protein [Actinocatenispora rupis]|uniref:hypothetical protein n=1 Tax=Actinocatenispora rupis TaxID=519421 RepID=UPI0019443CD8|nr:hypothetical protein [Actinocatenispora rupis]